MEALQHLEAIGYVIEFAKDEGYEVFRVSGINGESLPNTVWQYCDQHKEEIREALRQRQGSEV